MQLATHTKFSLILLVLFISLAWTQTGVYYLTHGDIIDTGHFEQWHTYLKTVPSEDSNHFRVLSIWTADGLSSVTGYPIHVSYLLIRFVASVILFALFYIFLTRWFSVSWSLFGVVFLAAIMPLSYLPVFQEADILLYIFFLAGLFFIRERKFVPLTCILFIGTFAKETIVFLIPLYGLLYWEKRKMQKTLFEVAGLSAAWLVAFFITRNALYEGSNFSLWQLPHNLQIFSEVFTQYPITNFHLFFIPFFGFMWVLSLFKKGKPMFFQKAVPYIIGYIAIHLISAWPEEPRVLLPLTLIMIPSSLFVIQQYVQDNRKLL